MYEDIINNNVIEFILDSIKKDKQYRSYFELKEKVNSMIKQKIIDFITPEDRIVLEKYGIEIQKIGKYSPILKNIGVTGQKKILFRIYTSYFYNSITLSFNSMIIQLDLKGIALIDERDIDIFNKLIKFSDEEEKDIQLLLKIHYDIFCELELLCEEYMKRIFKFKKGKTLLAKYPDYKKFLKGLTTEDDIIKTGSKLIEQFES